MLKKTRVKKKEFNQDNQMVPTCEGRDGTRSLGLFAAQQPANQYMTSHTHTHTVTTSVFFAVAADNKCQLRRK